MTYGGQGTNKRGVDASTHAIIYSGDKPKVCRGENLTRKPIRVSVSGARHNLDDASRLNYAKVYTVEYNVKVWFIGMIHGDSWGELTKDFAEVQSLRATFEPLPNTESPFQPTHKMLDSGMSIESKIIQTTLTVICRVPNGYSEIFQERPSVFDPSSRGCWTFNNRKQ